MAARLSLFEEFVVLFNNLKSAVKDSPKRLVTFYSESKESSKAVKEFQNFLLETDFERRVFHGPEKLFVQTPPVFEIAWNDYQTRWAGALSHIELRPMLLDLGLHPSFDPDASPEDIEPGPPDPQYDNAFDPRSHDLAAAIELGVKRWDIEAEIGDDEWVVNSCLVASDAYDYLVNTIRLDIGSAFARWRKVPVVFMPAHVSNRYGRSDSGSLPHLLDDAVRAYVFGAPAAAIAMCRAAYHMVKRNHYDHEQLQNAIILVSERFEYPISKLVKKADEIMHNYDNRKRLSADDDRIIVNFLATVKFFIEHAPRR